MNSRRLYRCRHDRQLAGVAAGMAEYLEMDPTVIRILWILSAFLGGFTILLYIILAFVMPLEPVSVPAPGPWRAGGPVPSAPPPEGGDGAGDADEAAGPGSDPTAEGEATSGWTSPDEWVAPTHRPRPDAGRGRVGLFVGVLLVVFGAIALVDALVPAWAAAGLLWPAFILALGAAMVVAAIRRPAAAP